MKLHVVFALLLATAAAAAAQSPAHTTVPWSYDGKTGPAVWSRLDSAYAACSKGRAQSPINIRRARLNKALAPIEFHYLASSATITNNGSFFQLTPKTGGYIVANGTRYELTELDFHSPSESAINGVYADLDVELVHQSAEGKLVILEIRFERDQDIPNALLATIADHLPQLAGRQNKIDDLLNPAGFLPADRGYWTYSGSLTTPPCTEGVQWYVLEQDMTLSRAQYRAFTSTFRLNSRPLQDTHGRRIEANE